MPGTQSSAAWTYLMVTSFTKGERSLARRYGKKRTRCLCRHTGEPSQKAMPLQAATQGLQRHDFFGTFLLLSYITLLFFFFTFQRFSIIVPQSISVFSSSWSFCLPDPAQQEWAQLDHSCSCRTCSNIFGRSLELVLAGCSGRQDRFSKASSALKEFSSLFQPYAKLFLSCFSVGKTPPNCLFIFSMTRLDMEVGESTVSSAASHWWLCHQVW